MELYLKQQGRRTNNGKKVAILSHGFGTDQDAWAALLPWLEFHFDVVTFNLAGCGPKGAETYDFERHSSLFGYADDLINIMDELALQDCTYIGHSMSGMIGAVVAAAQPCRFSRVIMIGASPRYLNDEHYIGGFNEQNLEHLFESMAANYQAWVAGFAPMVVGVDDREAIADFSRTLFQMRPDIALNTSRTIFNSDMRIFAPQLSMPVHLIQASVDAAVPVAVGQWLTNTIKGSTLDIIDAHGHLPHITAPDAILEIFERYLSGPSC